MPADTSTATPDSDRDADRPLPLVLASAAVAAAVLLSLVWLFLGIAEEGVLEALELLTRDTTLEVARRSLVVVGVVTVASIGLAVPLAYLTVRTDLPLSRFWTVAVTLPLVVPSYIGAFTYAYGLRPHGQIQSLLEPLGVHRLPEVDGFSGTVFVLTLYTYPYVYVTTRAALKTIDTQLVDAARTLRHTRWEAFKRVVVPQIRPAVAAGALLVALYALSDFGTPDIMQYPVFTQVIFTEYKDQLAGGAAQAKILSLQLLAVTLFVLAVESRLRGNERLYSGRGGGRTGETVRLGLLTVPALLFCSLVVLLALGVPIFTFGFWYATAGADQFYSVPFELQDAVNSVTVSVAAAGVAALAALPVAYLAARHRSRVAAVFERVSYLGYAIPGVVLGVSMVYFSTRFVPTLYQTLPVLVFAYVVRFLPQAVGSMRASFLRVNPQLPEAARTLGRSSVGAFRSVTLPLVAPGVLGGMALVFLTTMKELPVTLMLSPNGFQTIATHIWQAQTEATYADVVLPGAILLVVSGLSMVVILFTEGYDVK